MKRLLLLAPLLALAACVPALAPPPTVPVEAPAPLVAPTSAPLVHVEIGAVECAVSWDAAPGDVVTSWTWNEFFETPDGLLHHGALGMPLELAQTNTTMTRGAPDAAVNTVMSIAAVNEAGTGPYADMKCPRLPA